MTNEPATALAKAAQQVHDAARVHKRSEFAHRRQARALMQTFDELQRICQQHGITIQITKAKESIHGREQTRTDS